MNPENYQKVSPPKRITAAEEVLNYATEIEGLANDVVARMSARLEPLLEVDEEEKALAAPEIRRNLPPYFGDLREKLYEIREYILRADKIISRLGL